MVGQTAKDSTHVTGRACVEWCVDNESSVHHASIHSIYFCRAASAQSMHECDSEQT